MRKGNKREMVCMFKAIATSAVLYVLFHKSES